MRQTLFISDLHLEESRQDILSALERFLAQHKHTCDALYILGDFFENWIGDDEQSPLQRHVIDLISAYTQADIPVYFQHGNRDFLIGQEFAQLSGCQLLDEETVIDLYGHRTLLMHGDSLCTLDKGYMNFRKNARNPQWQNAFLSRPLADRQTVARQLREISMAQNKGKAAEIMDVTPDEVVQVMDKHAVNLLIHGHTHRPDIHDVTLTKGNGKRVVLGDWDKNGWYLAVDSSSLQEAQPHYQLQPFPLSAP